ncbi:hypothetical protein ACFL17_09860 [Pseudomonadota bacterium]
MCTITSLQIYKNVRSSFLFLFIVCIVLPYGSLQAKDQLISLEKITVDANFIIRGTVVDSKSRWGDRGIMIFTDYTLQVLEDIKGNLSTNGISPSQLVMSFAGGTVGNRSISVSGTPYLQVEEEYIVFGYDNKRKYAVPVVGGYQGIFKVLHDTQNNTETITDYSGRQLEITNEQELVKGPPIQKDPSGALVERGEDKSSVVNKFKPNPIIRDLNGNIVPQSGRIHKKPNVRPRGKKVTKKNFFDFIRKVIQSQAVDAIDQGSPIKTPTTDSNRSLNESNDVEATSPPISNRSDSLKVDNEQQEAKSKILSTTPSNSNGETTKKTLLEEVEVANQKSQESEETATYPFLEKETEYSKSKQAQEKRRGLTPQ